MASFEQRLDALEGALPAPVLLAAQHAYAEAWDASARAIGATMSAEHWELIVEADAAMEAAGHRAAWQVPDGPGRRLLRAFRSRIVARIGSGPEFDVPPRWPLSPVALPPVVAEIYMQQDVSAGLFVFEGKVCADCSYMVPVLSRKEPAIRGTDGVSCWSDGEQASIPGVPFIAIEGKAWRHLQPIELCPLCGGPIVTPANWHDGLGAFDPP